MTATKASPSRRNPVSKTGTRRRPHPRLLHCTPQAAPSRRHRHLGGPTRVTKDGAVPVEDHAGAPIRLVDDPSTRMDPANLTGSMRWGETPRMNLLRESCAAAPMQRDRGPAETGDHESPGQVRGRPGVAYEWVSFFDRVRRRAPVSVRLERRVVVSTLSRPVYGPARTEGHGRADLTAVGPQIRKAELRRGRRRGKGLDKEK